MSCEVGRILARNPGLGLAARVSSAWSAGVSNSISNALVLPCLSHVS